MKFPSKKQQQHQHQQYQNIYELTKYLVEYESTRSFPSPDVGGKGYSHRCGGSNEYASHSYDNPSLMQELSESTNNGSLNHSKSRQQRPLQLPRLPPQIKPKRHLEDCLFIVDHYYDHTSEDQNNRINTKTTKVTKRTKKKNVAMMISLPGGGRSSNKLDLNSIWVEMLLHDQQKSKLEENSKNVDD